MFHADPAADGRSVSDSTSARFTLSRMTKARDRSSNRFEATMTVLQREAATLAHTDHGIPAPEVSEMAQRGLLKLRGEPVGEFTITATYVRQLKAGLVKRRQGRMVSELARLPAGDAIEALRRRLVNLADAELIVLERQKAGKLDLARFKEVIKCVREAAALPGPKDPRPDAPGKGGHANVAGGPKTASGNATRGGLTGALLAEHRRTARNEVPENDESPQGGLSNGAGGGEG